MTVLEREGKAGSYIASNVKAVKSWLAHNGIEVKRKIRIRGAHDTPSLATEHAPSLSEPRIIFANCTLRTKCAAAHVAEAGLRLESIGNYHGTDGLTAGDLPGMKIRNGEGEKDEEPVTFTRIPTLIIVLPIQGRGGQPILPYNRRPSRC